MMKGKTVKSLAQEMLDNFKYSEREDGSKYWHLIEDINWERDICQDAHGDRLPRDAVYEVIVEALETIAETETIEEAQERLGVLSTAQYLWKQKIAQTVLAGLEGLEGLV